MKDLVSSGCIVAVSYGGFGAGLDESEALRNLYLACGRTPKVVELYRSPTIRRGSVFLDEDNYLCFPGSEEPPVLYAILADGRRTIIENGEPVAEPPKGYVAKMLAKRKV